MPKKQIQLRGISRTPSDRMTADGGCAESLNVQMDGDELAPAIRTKDRSTELANLHAGEGLPDDIFFVHKVSGQTNYLAHDGESLTCYVDVGLRTVRRLEIEGAKIGDTRITAANSMGSVVKILTDNGDGDCMQHFLVFKDGRYSYLGQDVPEPMVEFRVTRKNLSAKGYDEGDSSRIAQAKIDISSDDSEAYKFSGWGNVLSKLESSLTDGERTILAAIRDMESRMWGETERKMSSLLDEGLFSMPVLARYALRMYDGEYVHVSAPVFLGAGFSEKVFHIEGYHAANADYSYIENSFCCVYKAMAYLREWEPGSWSEFIESINLFISPYLSNPAVNAKFKEWGTSIKPNYYNIYCEESDMEDQIRNTGQFYKIASFHMDETGKLASGYNLLEKPEMGRQEYLLTQEALKSDSTARYFSLHERLYNGRAAMGGVIKTLSSGYHFQQSSVCGRAVSTSIGRTHKVKYYITGEDGSIHAVLGRSSDNGAVLGTYYDGSNYSTAYGVIFYPDARCTKMELQDVQYGKILTIPMKEHPSLNCAYAYLGAGVSIPSLVDTEGVEGHIDGAESPDITYENKLMLTKAGNYFAYDLASTVNFQDAIVDVAATTKALSTGQFGQFPLTVFTKGGIFSVAIASDGTFAATHPISREVALPGSITPIDQAVVFSTDKGVMLLSGSEVNDLSPNMRGVPYYIGSEHVEDVSSPWGNLIYEITDDDPGFLEFMSGARAAYDYKHGRLVFLSESYPLAYVYMLATSTWHKLSLGKGMNLSYLLNSYPDCLACMTDHHYSFLWDFSPEVTTKEYLDTAGYAVDGIVATRPFDLDAPDVRKVITDLRVRGRFGRGDVQYILFGSLDGIAWERLRSLRGGSYKLFRLVLLTHLSPSERISWIDVEYDLRFTNRMR